jgi:excisionase family DNA binding protein
MALSPKQVADDLQVCRETVYSLLHSGKIEHFRVGRQLRISEDALARFKEQNTRIDRRPGWSPSKQKVLLSKGEADFLKFCQEGRRKPKKNASVTSPDTEADRKERGPSADEKGWSKFCEGLKDRHEGGK